jgi:pseudouridine synthase
MRLQKYLASCGVASRRKSEELVAAGRVRVNGRPATIGQTIDPAMDEITLDGSRLAPDRHVYILLNKPRGVVTSARDTHRRKTVTDCVAELGVRVYPVGRLDLDVEGALIMTNDGELANRLTHPRYGAEKTYMVWVEGAVSPDTAAKLETGVLLEDGPTAPARCSIVRASGQSTVLRLVLYEGRKREVKRMCAEVGHPVRRLRRTKMGGIGLRGLKPGQWRYLGEREIEQLKKAAGISG